MSEKRRRDTILIVDDTPTNLDLLFRYLDRSGYSVLLAQDGKTALGMAIETLPDIVLLDVMMPEMDGFEMCQAMKQIETTREIPVIFMTALNDVESKVQGFAVGAVDYVTKPIRRREVLARIETHLTLRRLQKKLQAEIAEREKAEEALRQSMVKLQLRNNELDSFAQMVAHDLKNPLSTLTSVADILVTESPVLTPDELNTYLESIRRGGQKATNIIEELLVLASVREQQVELVPLSMGAIITEAQRRLYYMIDRSQAELIHPESWPMALGYGPWVEEIWVNYLSNAIKYGGQPIRIELGATAEADNIVRFWVKDNGPGLSSTEQAKLFTPFTRLSEVRAQGHGLGLSIVRRIAEKLGGQATVESTGVPDQGCTFSFTLLATAPPTQI